MPGWTPRRQTPRSGGGTPRGNPLQHDLPAAGGDVDMVDQGVAMPDPEVPKGVNMSKAQNEFLERPSTDWPPYAALLDTAILPLVSDLADAVMPLLVSGLRGQRLTSRAAAASTASAEPSGSAYHFELLACDLMVDVEGGVHLMEVEPRSLRQLSTA